MKKSALLLGLVLLATMPAMAQEYPRAEIFGAFSWVNADAGPGPTGGPAIERQNGLGWQASVSGNFHKNFGIVADFGGQYKSESGVNLSAYEYLFGPRFIGRGEKATGFVHALFGFATARASVFGVSVSKTEFAMAFGGGLDVNAGNRIAIRVIQFDWIPVPIDIERAGTPTSLTLQNIRLGFGVVIKAGGGS